MREAAARGRRLRAYFNWNPYPCMLFINAISISASSPRVAASGSAVSVIGSTCAPASADIMPQKSAGASGAVYGIIAMAVYLMYVAKKRTGSVILLYRIAIMLAFLFYSNFVNGRGVDIAAHIGGLVFGVILSLIFLPYKTKKQ